LEEAEPDEKLAIGLGLVSAAVITFALYPLLFAITAAQRRCVVEPGTTTRAPTAL
jgi:hypothetical protein